MKLELLLEREDFKNIFSRTLSNFLNINEEWSGSIIWSEEQDKNCLNLFINKRLNLIFSHSCSSEELMLLSKEYSYHRNFFKRFLQKIYIYFSVSRQFRGLFCDGYIQIDPVMKSFSKFCILPGNHSIRIVDLVKSNCVVLAKHGEKIDYLERNISVRSKNTNIPGPKLLDWSLEHAWFTEERITGIPINRIKNKNSIEIALLEATSFMQNFYKDTLIFKPFLEWQKEIEESFLEKITVFSKLDSELSTELINFFNTLKKRIKEEFRDIPTICTALTHGDFQEANILISLDNRNIPVYIIDWEYSRRRYLHYDFLVLELKTRFPKGLAKRIKSFQEESLKDHGLFKGWEEDKNFEEELKKHLYIFLLEDLLFRLEDSTISEMKEPPKSIYDFMREMRLVVKHPKS